MAEQDMKYNITKFNGTDFRLWKNKILIALNAGELEDVIQEEFKLDDGQEDEKKAKMKKDNKAKVILVSTIHDNILRNLPIDTAKSIWKALVAKYEYSNIQNIISLRRKLMNIKQLVNETIVDYIDRVMNLKNEIEKTENSQMKEQDLAILLLQGLSQDYDYFVQVLTANATELKLEKISTSLIQEEQRRSDKKPEVKNHESDVFYSKQNSKKKFVRGKITCYNCNKPGHIAKDCRFPKRDRYNKNANINVKSETKTRIDEVDNHLFHISSKYINSKKAWILDSGATNHMCCDKAMFKVLEPYKSIVQVGDGRKLQVKGIGTVECEIITNNIKKKLTISETLYLPDLSTNLISIGVLSEKGFKINFEQDMCKITKENEVIAIGVKVSQKSKLFQLPIEILDDSQALVTYSNDWQLWHQRMGHLSTQNLKKLKAEDVDFSNIHLRQEFCEVCAIGKAKKLPHKETEKNEKNEHVTIHSDLAGPMQTPSISNKRYMLTYICSQSEYSFVYYLKTKDEQLEKFKEFKEHYELFTNSRIKFFKSDNGGEYLSSEFQHFLKQNGIKHLTSVANCPQSNGKAERLNLTLLMKARCMLNGANLNFNLWTAAIDTANYLRNRSPSSVLNNRTPYEKYYGKLPKIKHLKIFGCDAFPLNFKDKDKFEVRAFENCKMIGYGDTEGIYWIYNTENQKIFRSRDVKFNEKSLLDTNISITINNENFRKEENEPDENERTEDEEDNNEHLESKPDITEEDKTVEEEEEKSNDEEIKTVKEKRQRIKTKRYQPGEYDTQSLFSKACFHTFEPFTYEEAINSQNERKWREAINAELDALDENETWEISNLPKGKAALRTKWVFKIKKNINNEPERYKARLVAKGFDQEEGIDYKETFAPVVRIQAIRLLIAVAVNEGLKIHHVDICTAFLNGTLEEEVYIEPPKGFRSKLNPGDVLRLKKALYGLKQASRAWNKTFTSFLTQLNFKQLQTDNCIFINNSLIIAIYVDDTLIIGSDENKIQEFVYLLNSKFKTKDLGPLVCILGLQIEYLNNDTVRIHQKNYIERIIKTFKLQDTKNTDIPLQPNQKLTKELLTEDDLLRSRIDSEKYRTAIGSLIYLMVSTRPDISYTVSVLSRFMQEPRELHWRCVKRLLRYIKTTKDFCLIYSKKKVSKYELVGYSDADYAGSIDDRKSTSGYVFKLNNCIITWNSAKQKTVSLSSTEAEYIALTTAIKEALWLNQLLKELNRGLTEIKMMCDNKSTICLSKNPEFHSRSKHIDIKYHFIKEKISDKTINIEYISTDDMIADIFTKAVSRIKHYKALEQLTMKN
jgi:hypothetical protein